MNRKNNFDFLRLIFASFVIVTHSYPLSGSKGCDILCQVSGGQVVFSDLGVLGFFVISGYLIFQSLERSENILDYYWKRILRLFPALIGVLLLTILLAPIVYESAIPYLQNQSVWTYLINNLSLYYTQYHIVGVFESNPYKSAINGSLWTIPYEFTMYALLSFFILFRKKKLAVVFGLASIFLVLVVCNVFFSEQIEKFTYILTGKYLIYLGLYFSAGAFLSAVGIHNIAYKNQILIFSCLFLIVSVYFGFFKYAAYIAFPIAVVLFGISSTPFISRIGEKIGDLSYGIYIYGFPVQQTLMYYFNFNHSDLMIASLLATAPFGYISWHLIEKRALTRKKLPEKLNRMMDKLKNIMLPKEEEEEKKEEDISNEAKTSEVPEQIIDNEEYLQFKRNALFPAGHYYSSIISVDEVKKKESVIWKNENKDGIVGVNLQSENQLNLIKDFESYYDDLPFDDSKIDGLRYYFQNEFYSYSDAIFLYSMIRHFEPKRIIEVGSGFSSAVILDTNEIFLDNRIKLTFVEPYADRLHSLINEKDRSSTTIIEKDVQVVELERFEELEAGDILFIDSTHVVKTGSDVNYIFFEILPRLQSGVLIHFHDIFYPFEYPRDWVFRGFNWNENYFLNAFLMYNNDFEIKLFSHYLHKIHPEIFEKMPLCYKNAGGNFWLEKR